MSDVCYINQCGAWRKRLVFKFINVQLFTLYQSLLCSEETSLCCAVLGGFSQVQLSATPRTAARQPRLPMWFSKQGGGGLPCPPPGDLPNPGIEPRSPALQADSLPSEPPGKPKNTGVGSLSCFRGSSRPRNQTGVSCIVGGFLIS